jgi:hypothetical protein
MAPEQMEAADNIDTRSDIWAIGAILYELLVGRPPYTGESLPQIFMKIMRSKTPRPSAERDDVGSELDAIVARCLALEPDERFATVADLAWALSTTGVPHARDSAERISRVFDRRSAECGVARVAPEPPVAVRPPPTGVVAVFRRKLAASASAALLLGAAVGFTALALERANDDAPADARANVVVRPRRALEVLTPTAVAGEGVTPRARMVHVDAGIASEDSTADASTVAIVPAAATMTPEVGEAAAAPTD